MLQAVVEHQLRYLPIFSMFFFKDCKGTRDELTGIHLDYM